MKQLVKNAGLWLFIILITGNTVFAQAPPPVFTATWLKASSSEPWLATTNTERGMAWNKITQHILVASRAAGVAKIIITDANGNQLRTGGELDMTGVTGGTFAFSEVAVTADGQIFAANLALSAATIKIYRWANETAAPTVVYSGILDGPRYGDGFGVSGTGNDIKLYISGTGNDRIAEILWNGTTGTHNNYLIPEAGADIGRMGIAPTTEGTIWINSPGKMLTLINATTGAKIAEVGAAIISGGLGDVTYFTKAGKKYVATGPNPNSTPEYVLLDVTDPLNPAIVGTIDPTTGTNGNATGALAYDNVNNRLLVLNTNIKLAAYSLTPVFATPVIVDEVVFKSNLISAYPNPFTATATIKFELAESANVGIEVFDILGRKIYQTQKIAESGINSHEFTAENWVAGAYFVKLSVGHQVKTTQITLIK